MIFLAVPGLGLLNHRLTHPRLVKAGAHHFIIGKYADEGIKLLSKRRTAQRDYLACPKHIAHFFTHPNRHQIIAKLPRRPNSIPT